MDIGFNPYYAFLLVLLLAPPILILIERIWPSIKTKPVFRKEFYTDVAWYFVGPVFQRLVAPLVLVVLVVIPFYLLFDRPLEQFRSGFGPLAELPLALQSVIALVMFDFVFYWHHRLFHKPVFWSIHSIHHSSENLDWLSAQRIHPLNEVGGQLLVGAPLVFIGVSPVALAILLPVLAANNLLVHANVDWDFGPLRRVIISPRFHRWHHAKDAEAKDKNFAAVFPLWDIIFGTFYLPERKAERFGIHEEVPESFAGQMLYPFRRRKGTRKARQGTPAQTQSDVMGSHGSDHPALDSIETPTELSR